MRKIERHHLNLERFGPQHCPRQAELATFETKGDLLLLRLLIQDELDRAGRVGLRTDWPVGKEPTGGELGLLPFRTNMMNQEEVSAFFREERVLDRRLAVLVCEAIPMEALRFNFVSEQLDHETVYIEYSSHPVPQRNMYEAPELLRELCVGPDSYALVHGVRWVRCYRPSQVYRWRMNEIYDWTLLDREKTLTGTITRDGRLLFW